MTPIVFGLGVNSGVAIDLACRSLENWNPQPFGQPQHVDGAMHTGFGRLDRVILILGR